MAETSECVCILQNESRYELTVTEPGDRRGYRWVSVTRPSRNLKTLNRYTGRDERFQQLFDKDIQIPSTTQVGVGNGTLFLHVIQSWYFNLTA